MDAWTQQTTCDQLWDPFLGAHRTHSQRKPQTPAMPPLLRGRATPLERQPPPLRGRAGVYAAGDDVGGPHRSSAQVALLTQVTPRSSSLTSRLNYILPTHFPEPPIQGHRVPPATGEAEASCQSRTSVRTGWGGGGAGVTVCQRRRLLTSPNTICLSASLPPGLQATHHTYI